ncbi:MAG: CPBP family intramembrane metalloprotease [Chlamydiia bacterium]|nr:CPBP family intramembrane metalloprotease [Chlamydiia bacterium]MCP5509909.1 CPBP family intramembrane metalloprotease [Chlamydiales bacterium]HPE85237.1 type II CAAX endopeptidase family protein [Chlamydiales bacterium]
MLRLAKVHKLAEHLQATAWMGSIGCIVTWIAYRLGFFRFKAPSPNVLISTPSLIEILGIFIVVSLLGPLFLIHVMTPIGKTAGVTNSDWILFLMTSVQLASQILITFLIALYAFAHKRIDLKGIFKTSKSSIWNDIGFGLFAWIVSFPVVATIDGLMESFNLYVFGREGPSQLAIQFILSLARSPNYLMIGILITVIAAPFIEEFIFRGCLQTYLRKRMHRKQAIVLSSIAFAFVHLAPTQGIGNIPLFTSIFAFGLYLGFVYERQGSLFASIALHSTFNAISIGRILVIGT